METTTNWMWLALVLASMIFGWGVWSAKNLPEHRKRSHIRRYALASLTPILWLFMFPPFVSDYSRTETLETLEQVDLGSMDDADKASKKQIIYINRLKDEVERLRKDLSRANDYYRHFTQTLAIGFMVFCFVFPSRHTNEREDEFSATPLGLDKYNE